MGIAKIRLLRCQLVIKLQALGSLDFILFLTNQVGFYSVSNEPVLL